MTATNDHILIIGGGTAGWLSAAILAKSLNSKLPEGVQVTLVESPDIPILGVGEGTWPAGHPAAGLVAVTLLPAAQWQYYSTRPVRRAAQCSAWHQGADKGRYPEPRNPGDGAEEVGRYSPVAY